MHTKRSLKQSVFNIVDGNGITPKEGMHIPGPYHFAEPFNAAGVHDNRPANDNYFATPLLGLANHLRQLTHDDFDAALGGNLAGHEGKVSALAVLEFTDNFDACVTPDHPIILLDVAQLDASGPLGFHPDHGIHALVFDLAPVPGNADEGTVIGSGVEIVRHLPRTRGGCQRNVFL